ncbi:hypothetical protein EDD11_003530 [Mortierella claussenii]|nr:hypothetical protein EDD11_003530 [Mortierella claussenii]
MHALAECPLRTYAIITTTATSPFHIISLDHSALDLFVVSSSSNRAEDNDDDNDGDDVDENEDDLGTIAQRRARVMQCLRGRPIQDVLLPDSDSSLSTTLGVHDNNSNNSNSTIQSFVITQQALSDSHSCISPRRPSQRRLHGCIHSGLISGPLLSLCLTSSQSSSAVTTTAVVPLVSCQNQQETTRLQDQVVPQIDGRGDGDLAHEQTQDQELDAWSSCRIYALKDVTLIHDLAARAATDNLIRLQYQQQSSRSSRSGRAARASAIASSATAMTLSSSFSSSSPSSSPPSSSQSWSPDRLDPHCKSVTHQKPYCASDHSDWSAMSLHQDAVSSSSTPYACNRSSSSSVPPSSPSYLHTDSTAHQQQHQQQNPGLLLLQVTRFGIVDHAFVLPQQKLPQHQQTQTQPQNQQTQTPQTKQSNDASMMTITNTADTAAAPITCMLLSSSHDDATADADLLQVVTNTSVMSYAHPDDLRSLCRGLDRVCKSFKEKSTIVFRIRWRVVKAQGQQLAETAIDSTAIHTDQEDDKMPEISLCTRAIEFQGETFEEWTDPTASAAPESTLTSSQETKYAWVEVRGVHSNGQPMLVVRPLTAQEIQEQKNHGLETSMLSKRGLISQRSTTSATQGGVEKNSKEWRRKKQGRSKCMAVEKGIKLPKQMNLSALTTLSTSSSLSLSSSSRKQEDFVLRMPGSLPSQPYQQLHQQQQQQSTSIGFYSASSSSSPSNSGMITMPTMLAYPSTTQNPWGMVLTSALDAWKQWIQIVHVGQAQFQDWCEYVLERTIDQLIEGVSLGMTMLGVEAGPCYGAQLEVQLAPQPQRKCQDVEKMCLLSSSVDSAQQEQDRQQYHQQQEQRDDEQNHRDVKQQQQQQQQQQRQCQRLSGLHRVGELLHEYPRLEVVARTFGDSWLGRKIRSRLEQKLDMASDQVVEWWYCSGGEQVAATSGMSFGNSSPCKSASTVAEEISSPSEPTM